MAAAATTFASGSRRAATDLLHPSMLAELEAKVLSPSATDGAVLHAVIKQYAFRPKESKTEVINLALAKAITLLPEDTFLQCLYLLPAKLDTDHSVSELSNLVNMLQVGNFSDAWRLATDPGLKPTLNKVEGFNNSLREYAASALEITYTRCPVTVVEKTLFLDAAEAVKFRPSWSVDGDVVVFPSRPENQPRAETVHVPLKYDDVAEAIKHLSK